MTNDACSTHQALVAASQALLAPAVAEPVYLIKFNVKKVFNLTVDMNLLLEVTGLVGPWGWK